MASGTTFTLEWIPPDIQNLLHVPAFALLAALLWHAVNHPNANMIRTTAIAFLLAAGFGVLDEWHQAGVPGRYGTLTDAALDWLGAFLGGNMAWWIEKRKLS